MGADTYMRDVGVSPEYGTQLRTALVALVAALRTPPTVEEAGDLVPGTIALTRRQALFLKGYLAHPVAARAARAAGYSRRSARSIGHELLRKPAIRAVAQAGLQAHRARIAQAQDDALKALQVLVDDALRAAVPVNDPTRDPAAPVDVFRLTDGQAVLALKRLAELLEILPELTFRVAPLRCEP